MAQQELICFLDVPLQFTICTCLKASYTLVYQQLPLELD